MRFSVKYGHGEQSAELPQQARLLLPRPSAPSGEAEAIIRAALENPIGTPPLRDIVQPGESVALIVSDISRPVPSRLFLPQLLEEVLAGGVSEADILIVAALGSHRGHSQEELRALVGEDIFQRFRVMDSDANDCLRLGVCANGTPADIFRPVAEADRLICTGNVEYHYFAGYSGGAKALLPGVSSLEAIRANHAHMVKPECTQGRLEGNPLREDIDQAAQFRPIDFIFNVLLDEHKQISAAFAGHYLEAHRAACRALDAKYQTPICRRADIVIASAGGYPKDINIYQSHKTLENARLAVAPGGVIVWCAACEEGFGHALFADWLQNRTPQQNIAAIRDNFVLGGHKAAAIASIMLEARIIMVSDLPRETVEHMGFYYAADLQQAAELALSLTSADASLFVMPYGGATLPALKPAISVTVELDTSLCALAPDRAHTMTLELPQGALMADLLTELALRQDMVEVMLVDKRTATPETGLYDGAVVSLFPMFGGG